MDTSKPVIDIEIPGIPSSVNTMYGQRFSAKYLKPAALNWKRAAVEYIKLYMAEHNTKAIMDGYVRLELVYYMPTFKRSDVDNRLKLTLDAIQASGIIKNDNQVVSLIVSKARAKGEPRTALKMYVAPENYGTASSS